MHKAEGSDGAGDEDRACLAFPTAGTPGGAAASAMKSLTPGTLPCSTSVASENVDRIGCQGGASSQTHASGARARVESGHSGKLFSGEEKRLLLSLVP